MGGSEEKVALYNYSFDFFSHHIMVLSWAQFLDKAPKGLFFLRVHDVGATPDGVQGNSILCFSSFVAFPFPFESGL